MSVPKEELSYIKLYCHINKIKQKEFLSEMLATHPDFTKFKEKVLKVSIL